VPHQALTDIPRGMASSSSLSFISMTTRNILRARGMSPAVYAVSANWRKVKGFWGVKRRACDRACSAVLYLFNGGDKLECDQ